MKYIDIIGKGFNKGMFSQILGWTIQILPFIDNIHYKYNLIPQFRLTSKIYGKYPSFSIIPHLIIPNNIIPNGIKPVQQYFIKDNFYKYIENRKNKYNNQYFSYKNDFELANRMFFKYFSIAGDITDQVNKFVKNNFNGKILGIHYRGTDKAVDYSFGIKRKHVSINFIIKVIKNWLLDNHIDLIFLCTDQEDVVKQFKNEFINIITYDQIISKVDKIGFHIQRYQLIEDVLKKNNIKEINSISESNVQLAKNALIDSLLLSNCDFVLKTQSQLSAWAKIFNPKLKIFRIGSLHRLYWPDVYIPLYQSNCTEINKELLLYNKNEIDNSIKNIPSNYNAYNNTNTCNSTSIST